MLTGVHALIFTPDADAVRAFFRDVLGLGGVDAGGGWPIFRLPPAELGIHPVEPGQTGHQELYLMCDNLDQTMHDLKSRGVEFPKPVSDEGWGLVTWIRLPGVGGEIALYEPRHPTAIGVAAD